MIILLFLSYAAIALFQIPSLVRKKLWRELVAFCCFLLFAFIFSLLIGLGVKIPSPLMLIQNKIQDPLNLHY
ncbi:hypothetical protein DFR58_101148 [Anaerobacterium chartisolvens]|uniref:Uncharacterized protein n=1 Tax=Anaerobacterium chartisolvens TaxID=1297424 RepID=A0A369BI59_9FIRM|nr:hypothetical protein DFR58_101148 [Anaerobacterium chartisolvens]